MSRGYAMQTFEEVVVVLISSEIAPAKEGSAVAS
jgi:hypothetical protein